MNDLAGFDLFPNEILSAIFSHFGPTTLTHLARVCQQFRPVALDPRLWYRFCHEFDSATLCSHFGQNHQKTFAKLYIKRDNRIDIKIFYNRGIFGGAEFRACVWYLARPQPWDNLFYEGRFMSPYKHTNFGQSVTLSRAPVLLVRGWDEKIYRYLNYSSNVPFKTLMKMHAHPHYQDQNYYMTRHEGRYIDPDSRHRFGREELLRAGIRLTSKKTPSIWYDLLLVDPETARTRYTNMIKSQCEDLFRAC
jgi:F-box-like